MGKRGGARIGAGNPGYSHTLKMRELLAKATAYAEQIMETGTPEQKFELSTKLTVKTAPQNVDITTLGDKVVQEIPLSQAEKELYAKLRLGLLAQSISADTKGISGSVGAGQPDEKRESGTAGV